MKVSMDHVGIRVRDFERSMNFYKKYFGFEQFDSYENPPPMGREIHIGRVGAVHIELFLVTSTKEPELDILGKKERGVCHVCFNVDNIEDVYEKMKTDGVTIVVELAKGNFDSGKWCKYFFFSDPDDTVIEVLEGYYS